MKHDRKRHGEALTWVVVAVALLCLMGGGIKYVQHRARQARRAALAVVHLDGATTAIDLGNGVKLELVRIEPGSFMMGSPDEEPERDISEGPQHKVTIGKPFYMGKYEVTQAQWGVIRGNQSHANIGSKFPAEGISWNDATAWCAEMSVKLHVHMRLPTEAEWEYACRAGTTTAFAFGPTLSGDQANFNNGHRTTDTAKTLPVGTYPPNAWGLYDMHGNVWEWCDDTLQGDYDHAPTNGSAWLVTANRFNRIRRGGSWNEPAANCRSAVRFGSASSEQEPDMRNDQLGFRVVVDVPAK